MPSIYPIFYLANFSLLFFVLSQFRNHFIETEYHKLFTISFLYKTIATVSLGLIYRYGFPYITDPETFFSESVKTHQFLLAHPHSTLDVFCKDFNPDIPYSMIPRGFFLVKIVAVLNFLTGDNYWLDSMWLSTLCFLCVWTLCLQIRKHYLQAFIPSIVAFLFVPSTVFWSSGMLKESLSFGMLCLLITLFIHALHHPTFPFKIILWALVPCYLLFRMRFYMLGSFLLIAGPYYLSVKIFPDASWRSVGLFCGTLILCWLAMDWVSHKQLNGGIIEITYYTHNVYKEFELADFNFKNLNAQSVSFLPYLPQALWYGLFRPQVWEAHSLLSFFEGFQNTLTFLLLVFVLARCILDRLLPPSLLFMLLFYVLLSALLITISSPNFGSLARYKLAYMPFLHFTLALYLFRHFNLTHKGGLITRFLAYFRVPK
jgi:hypothetical protein